MVMVTFCLSIYPGKSALGYKLGINILACNLVWIQGLYSAGKYTKIKMFSKVRTHFLELQPGKRVEADKGYRGHTDKVKCPRNDANPVEKWAMQGRVRVRHETWGILSQVFCHHHNAWSSPLRTVISCCC
jgi:hypothetical protein